MTKTTSRLPNSFNSNRAVQAQKMARGCKLKIYKKEKLFYSNSDNKGADQCHSNCETKLRFWYRICKKLVFSNVAPNGFFFYIFRLSKKSTSRQRSGKGAIRKKIPSPKNEMGKN